jgi:N utilization substance protein A
MLLAIEATSRGPELILSRASPRFVRRLFELEVAEIADGTVRIDAFAREPGYRTKIAVTSTDPKVDPVGACVGARGARVKSIVRELGGEKIDIVVWKADPKEMLLEALKPVVPRNIQMDDKSKRMVLDVAEEDLAIAIGRRGQNARLTSKLVGWRIDIVRAETAPTGLQERMREAAAVLSVIPGIDDSQAARLVAMGFVSFEAFEGVEVGDLVDGGFTEEEAGQILDKVRTHRGAQS